MHPCISETATPVRRGGAFARSKLTGDCLAWVDSCVPGCYLVPFANSGFFGAARGLPTVLATSNVHGRYPDG